MPQEKFMTWLKSGSEEMCIISTPQSKDGYFRQKLPNGFDVIYAYEDMQDDIIPLDQNPEYQGLYRKENGMLYDAKRLIREMISEDSYKELTYSELKSRFESQVRKKVEEMVAEFESDIKLDDTTKSQQESQKHSADETARKIYLQDIDTYFKYHCEYDDNNFKNKLIRYILDSETIVKETAENYLTNQKDSIIKIIVLNLMTQQKIQELENGKDKSLTAVKMIIQSIPEECKTVNITTVMDEKELTFKYEASNLRRDCKNSYSDWYMPAKDRREFEAVYGIHRSFTPMDITRITYGKKVLYEKEV